MQNRLEDFIVRVSKIFTAIAGTALTIIMLLTVADVFMRAFKRPIMGTYEIVGLLLAIVIGFAIPQVSLDRGHVYMEMLVEILSKKNRAILNTITRLLSIFIFIIISYNLFAVGNEFRISGEVSPTIKLPFFFIAYGIGICCIIQCLVLILDIVKIRRGTYE